MTDPKPAGTPVDTERVIHELLTPQVAQKGCAGHLFSASKNEQQQRSEPSQKDPAKALALVGSTLSNAASPRLPPTMRFKALMVPVSDFDEGHPQQAAVIESSENLESSDFQIEAQSTECGVIEGFCHDHGIIERLQVTPQELEALSEVSLLGSLTCRQDALFVLRQLRSAMKPRGCQQHFDPNLSRLRMTSDCTIAGSLSLFAASPWLDQMNSIHREISIIATRFTVLLSFRWHSS